MGAYYRYVCKFIRFIINQKPTYTEDELFQLLLSGREEAFDVIYDMYAVPLLNAAYKRLQSKEEAKEVVQEVFISLYLKKDAIKHPGNLSGYLFTALRNRILDIIKTDLLHASHHQQMSLLQSPHTDIEHELEQKELEISIRKAIAQLPDKCRKAFLLSRYEGLSYKEIAATLHVSVNTVEKHVGKALRLLRLQLNDTRLLLLLLSLCMYKAVLP